MKKKKKENDAKMCKFTSAYTLHVPILTMQKWSLSQINF